MAFRLKCCLLYSSHIVSSYSQSFCMSSINGSKNIYVNTSLFMTRYEGCQWKIHLWYNHVGTWNIHIITDNVLCGFLISPDGFIPSMLSPGLIFHGSLEKSSWWAGSKFFHYLPVGIFCTGKKHGDQDHAFQFWDGLANYREHYDLSWFKPLLGGNSPTSSGLILKMNKVYNGVSRGLKKFTWWRGKWSHRHSDALYLKGRGLL
jgi:hypothetical protein